MAKRNVIICGLPESGKTTFLAALWYAIFNKETTTALSYNVLPETREYLHKLSRDWSRFKQFDRTHTDAFEEILLHLRDGADEIDLKIPDMSGEKWRAIWTDRVIDGKIIDWIRNDSDVILFLNPENITLPISIEIQGSMERDSGTTTTEGEMVEWAAKDSPTQVILVDILQTIIFLSGNIRRRLSVVISLWDKVEDLNMDPERYLMVHLPLFYQFIKFNGFFIGVNFFGVSAQGGDFESPEDLERIKKFDKASERIKVVSQDKTTHDITLPIHCLILK